ncbi:MAG: DUF4153 domain-containing protein, partial [bacterium]
MSTQSTRAQGGGVQTASASIDRFRRPRPLLLAGAATVALVALADWLFYGWPLGWTAGLYLVVMAVVLWGARAFPAGRWGAMFALLLAGLALAMVEMPGVLEMVLAAVLVTAAALISRVGWTASVMDWLVRGGQFVLFVIAQPVMDIVRQRRWRRRRPESRGGMCRVARRMVLNWGAAVVLGGVFLGLFALANPIIDDWLGTFSDRLARWVERWRGWLQPARFVFWILVALGVWALLRVRARGAADSGRTIDADLADSPRAIDLFITTGLVVRSLAVFNALFLGQTSLDAYY